MGGSDGLAAPPRDLFAIGRGWCGSALREARLWLSAAPSKI